MAPSESARAHGHPPLASIARLVATGVTASHRGRLHAEAQALCPTGDAAEALRRCEAALKRAAAMAAAGFADPSSESERRDVTCTCRCDVCTFRAPEI